MNFIGSEESLKDNFPPARISFHSLSHFIAQGKLLRVLCWNFEFVFYSVRVCSFLIGVKCKQMDQAAVGYPLTVRMLGC